MSDPAPPIDLARVETTLFPAGMRLSRLYRKGAAEWNAFRPMAGTGRFDPGMPGESSSSGKAVLYTATSIESCFRGIIRGNDHGGTRWVRLPDDMWIASFHTTADLALAELRFSGWRPIVESPSYEASQALASSIFESGRFDGIIAPVRRGRDEEMIVLFPSAGSALPLTPDLNVPWTRIEDAVRRIAFDQDIVIVPTVPPRDALPSGLLGPDGEPLDPMSDDGKLVAANVTEVSDHLIRELSRNPEALYSLQPRTFELLIGEIFTREGYSVTLTAPSRDGGIDLYAVKRDGIGEFCLAIECKRYKASRPVGVGVVRAVHGVSSKERVSKAAIVTTSTFTSGALQFQREMPMLMALYEYDAVLAWVRRLAGS